MERPQLTLERLGQAARIPDPARRAFLRHAPSRRGQAAGVVLMLLPALVHPLPLDGPLHGTLEILSAVLASVGVALVFGGLVLRTWLRDVHRDHEDPAGLDVTLLALPGRRRIWLGLVAAAAVLGLGAVLCLVLGPGPGWGERLSAVLLFALPAVGLGLVAARFRAMGTEPPWGQAKDEPVSSP